MPDDPEPECCISDFSIDKYHNFDNNRHMYAKFPYIAFREQLDKVSVFRRIKTTNFECFICGINHSF